MSEQHSAMKAVDSGESKARVLAGEPHLYLLRSVLAGLYLSLVVMVFWALLQGLQSSPFGKVAASAFFGVGLSVIVFTHAELFTSNCFYLTISSLSKRTTWKQALAVWGASWLGNLAGALLLAGMFHQAGVLAALPKDHLLFTGALHKAQQTVAVLFWKGVLANWIVCLAVWMALRLEEEIAKITAIILVVFTFLYLGFEHSIANMGTFSCAMLGGGALTWSDAAKNLFWTTLGNLVGGGLFVGAAYAILGNTRAKSRAQAEELVGAASKRLT